MQSNAGEIKQSAARAYEFPLFGDLLGETFHPGGLKLTARLGEVAGINRSSRALDLACGKGAAICFFSQQYDCHVIGIDLSTLLVLSARSRVEDKKLSSKVDLLVGDGESLPFNDSAFDVVISECSFSLLPNKEVAVAEIERVLKPGGILAITDVILRGKMSEEFRTQATFASCIAGAESVDGYIEIFNQAGFKNPYVEDHSDEMKKVAYQIMVDYGSFESFSAQIGEGSGACRRECYTTAAGKIWQRLFKEAKPGYALIRVTKC